MQKFIVKIISFSLIGLVPVLVLVVGYVILDPFKVLKAYDSFYDIGAKGVVAVNKDFVSTSTLINNSKRISYNSFIFGNSRSIFYQVADWKKHLPASSTCFHYDASGEALWAMEKKIEFIDRKGIKIENALLVLDYATLIQDKPKTGHLFVISPQLVDNSNLIDFHKTFFLAFLSPKFLYAYLDYNVSGIVKPYMKENYLLDDITINYDIATNEIRYDSFEALIHQNQYYNSKRLAVFHKRDSIQKYSPVCIGQNQKNMLQNIQNIFKRHNTGVRVVISPLYSQEKLNSKDLAQIKNVFGADNVFDFSGINKFTNNFENYYENSHYRPHVAREIMEEIYQNK